MNKKSICFFLVAVLMLCLSGCQKSAAGKTNTPSAKASDQSHGNTVTLLFNKSDSLDPYTAKSENNRLITKLIFEPLVKTDDNLEPVNRLAEEVRLEGKTCTVTLKSARFSDGSAVTSSDVVYSYNIAKNYGGLYTSHLYEVSSISALSADTVAFSLTANDPYFANLLDFPVLKAGSEKATDSDGNLKTPIGCGRYAATSDPYLLSQNEHFFGENGAIKEIKLINAPDDDSISHYIEIGAADLYYSDLSSDNLVRMSGSRTDINLNTLIYIGINTASAELKDKRMRYAISSALDRTAICQDAFFNSATPASGYFNPVLTKTSAVQSLKPRSDSEITIDNLKKIGYNDKNADGYFVDANGKHHIFKLLVNKESRSKAAAANLIAAQLRSAGIQVTVTECSYGEFLSRLSTNSFELYLGEISILPNFDMSPLVVSGGSAAYGLGKVKTEAEENKDGEKDAENEAPGAADTENAPIKKIYDEYKSGAASISDVAGTLLTEMPQIPLLYKHGLLFSNDHISNIEASECDVFFSIEKYKIK